MEIQVNDMLKVDVTIISNEFLDNFMIGANGDYVKVYLYLIRHKGEQFDEGKVADCLNLTDSDVRRAVKYWEKLGVLASVEKAEEKRESRTEVETEGIGTAHTVFEEMESDEDFQSVIFVAKHLLPGTPTAQQIEAFYYMYQKLHMSAELIEHLIEYCAGLKKTSTRYMETVARNWYEQGITTVKDAIASQKAFEEKKENRAKKQNGKQNRFHNFEQRNVDYDAIALNKAKSRLLGGEDAD